MTFVPHLLNHKYNMQGNSFSTKNPFRLYVEHSWNLDMLEVRELHRETQ